VEFLLRGMCGRCPRRPSGEWLGFAFALSMLIWGCARRSIPLTRRVTRSAERGVSSTRHDSALILTGSATASGSKLPAPSVWRYGCVVADYRTVTVPVVVECDEDGVWCAHAQLRPGLGAHGEGTTEGEALDDLREALTGLIEEFGVPQEMSVTVAA